MSANEVHLNDRPTTLYRAYGAGDVLLYVGIAVSWPARWERHRERSPWFGAVESITLEQFPDRRSALDAEQRAVESERPAHNIEYTARDTRPAHWRKGARSPATIRDFDHREHAARPEYAAMAAALDALASSKIELASQEVFAQMAADVARAVPYSDQCDACSKAWLHLESDEWMARSLAAPCAVELQGTHLTAVYHHWCGATWECFWHLDAPWILG